MALPFRLQSCRQSWRPAITASWLELAGRCPHSVSVPWVFPTNSLAFCRRAAASDDLPAALDKQRVPLRLGHPLSRQIFNHRVTPGAVGLFALGGGAHSLAALEGLFVGLGHRVRALGPELRQRGLGRGDLSLERFEHLGHRGCGGSGRVFDLPAPFTEAQGVECFVGVGSVGRGGDEDGGARVAPEGGLEEHRQLGLVVRHVRLALHQRVDHLAQRHEGRVDLDGLAQAPALRLGALHLLGAAQVDQVDPAALDLPLVPLHQLAHEHRVGPRRPLVHRRGRLVLVRLPRRQGAQHLRSARHPQVGGALEGVLEVLFLGRVLP
mmetsp:Transcript_23090/g.52077  ORF Transcript_23090/g.52077 Transcript_23090/m.52077 type:complete len:323 (-) Transcript_23090:727-1695(-)